MIGITCLSVLLVLINSALFVWITLPQMNEEGWCRMSYLSTLRKKLTETYPFGGPKREVIPDDKIDWNVPWPDYSPPKFTAKHVLTNKIWADEDMIPGRRAPTFKWNSQDGKVNRTSFCGPYKINDGGFPLNPAGRTGIAGRGNLGKWGPNHAADTIVTRAKKTSDGSFVTNGGKGVYQFIGIQRKDTGEWAVPGGMIDPGEDGLAAAKREFYEEVFSIEKADEAEKKDLDRSFSQLFSTKPILIYKGYVDDPRSTDNAWIETQAIHFHAENQEIQKFLDGVKLKAGSDARNAAWVDISSSRALYASHRDFIKKVAESNGWHW